MSKRMIDRVRIGFSPLSGKLYLYRHGVDPSLALEKRDADADVMYALRSYLMHDSPSGSEMEFRIDGDWFRVTLVPIDGPTDQEPAPHD